MAAGALRESMNNVTAAAIAIAADAAALSEQLEEAVTHMVAKGWPEDEVRGGTWLPQEGEGVRLIALPSFCSLLFSISFSFSTPLFCVVFLSLTPLPPLPSSLPPSLPPALWVPF